MTEGPGRPVWDLVNFDERFQDWVDREDPIDPLRTTVLSSIFTRFDDPYVGVRREPGFDNLWFGRIPGTEHGESSVVVWSYFVEERTHSVVCSSIATLNEPV